MADIAMIFHWTPEAMDTIDLHELLDWHARALERWEAQIKAMRQG